MQPDDALAACRLIAILIGVHPDKVLDVGEVLIGVGFSILEIPLNSPDAFSSIEALAAGSEATL
jgi:2-dehydro-3-deoxyphosphogalactonate aldolase